MGTFVCPVCSLPGSLYDEEYIRLPDTRRYIHTKCWRCYECQQPLHQWRETTTNHFVCQMCLEKSSRQRASNISNYFAKRKDNKIG